MFKANNMKIVFSLLFIACAALISIFFTAPQFMCTKANCQYDGIKKLATDKVSFITALKTAESLESRRGELESKYNNVTNEDRQKLEALLPNNADNIKLVLELETLAKKYGLLIESPKLQNNFEAPKTEAKTSGQDLRADAHTEKSGALNYGTFSLDFTVRTNYENMKLLIADIEKNLRLIEPISIEVNVPNQKTLDKNKVKLYPPGTYDVKLNTVIYYLKN